MKILAVCAHGLGSSFLMEMNLEKALKNLNIEATVEHSDLSLTSNDDADLFVMSADLVDSANFDEDKIISLTNLVSMSEYEEKLSAYFENKRGDA